MGDQPTHADLMKKLDSLTSDMSALKADVEGIKGKSASTSEGSGKRAEAPRDLDRPPRFQKMDFPRFDGKSDPLIFINRCVVFSPATHHAGEGVDGVVQPGGCGPIVVPPTPGG
jgi:hypothetical protein